MGSFPLGLQAHGKGWNNMPHQHAPLPSGPYALPTIFHRNNLTFEKSPHDPPFHNLNDLNINCSQWFSQVVMLAPY